MRAMRTRHQAHQAHQDHQAVVDVGASANLDSANPIFYAQVWQSEGVCINDLYDKNYISTWLMIYW